MTRIQTAAAAFCIAIAAAPSAAPAQVSPGTLTPGTQVGEVVKRLLVSPGDWLMNWPDTAAHYVTANAALTFEERDGALIVLIRNLLRNIGCEKPVVVTGDRVTFDGCIERNISLRFTPDDPVFPFRGESPQRWYTLRPY
ncbi:hypothetical protein [Elioraea sp.]|uniref:hypothetical protein n=1 Tax=Elioraea sp. TaxID=2185103 RepID=UPI0025C1DD6E|nr:hypothetical protein [Elioraea sp.]